MADNENRRRGNLYVASIFDVSETDRRICLTRYDSSFQLQWRAFGPPNGIGGNWNTAWQPIMRISAQDITLSYLGQGQGYYSEYPHEHGEIARFSTNGNLLWTRAIKGNTATVLHGDAIHAFEVDSAGNVLFLAAFNDPNSVSTYHYGKLTSAGDLQFIKPAGSLLFNLNGEDFTRLYQGTQLLVLNQISSNVPPPDDTYDIVLFQNPANQLVPVTLDADQPADQTVIAGANVQLRVINRGSAATYQWRKKDGLGVPQNIPGATLDRLFLNNVTTADAGEYSVLVTNALDAATSRTATLTVLTPAALDVALDTPGRTWSTGGNAPWAGFIANLPAGPAHDTVDAAMPGNIGHAQSSWVETTVTGPAIVSFWWKADTRLGDALDFSVDGNAIAMIQGDQDWTSVTHDLGAGTHTLRWTFQKDSDLTEGRDRVWLDQVAIAAILPLPVALDTNGISWATGSVAWKGIESVSHDGTDSAVSGTIGNNAESFMETSITGPATLSFWWKASSEAGFDFLKLSIDGTPSGSISGEQDWVQVTRPIPAGLHTIRWTYEKDSVAFAGQDRGWVDEVVFTGGTPAAPVIVIEQPELHSLTDNASSVDFGTALPGNTTVRTFTIRNTGNAPLSSIVISKSGGPSAALFTIGALSTTDPVLPGGTATFDVTFAPTAAGARGAALHITSNDPDESPFDIGIYGTGGMPISNWRLTHFGSADNSGDAADDADSDNDGVPNLLEFATAGNPAASTRTPGELAPVDDSGLIYFTYTRNKQAMTEITFQVEWADNLLGPWSSSGVVETVTSDNGLVQTVTAALPAGTSGHRFVRLKVSR